MKAKISKFAVVGILLVLSSLSCNRSQESQDLKFAGIWTLTVSEKNLPKSETEGEIKTDTTFKSLFRGLEYIPDNSEWNFTNDSMLIIKTNYKPAEPDTVSYRINASGDYLMIESKQDMKKLKILTHKPDRIVLDPEDGNVIYTLTLNNKDQK